MRKGTSTSFDDLTDSEPRRRKPPPPYLDLDTLRNADKLVSIISQRTSNGVITFGIFKEFERDGRIERTSFVGEGLRDSYLALFKLTVERIDAIKTDSKLLAELQQKAGYEPPAGRLR